MIIKILRESLGRIIILLDYLTRPKKMKRTSEQQTQVDQATSKLTLYQFYACPFCIKTRRAMHKLNLKIRTCNATKESAHRQDLINGGGKVKTPCLKIDSEKGTQWMYESKAIIQYLNAQFHTSN